MKTGIFAYAKEHYLNGKYIGSTISETPDRDITGYDGRQNHLAKEKIMLEKKVIKAGQQYQTILIPLSGRQK
jgi:hypothetical protein